METNLGQKIFEILDDYQPQAATTAVYPAEVKIAYPALGVVEECYEFLDTCFPRGEPVDPEAVLKEAGDVYWYCAALASDLGLGLSLCYYFPSEKITTPGELLQVVSELAGHCKKICRGDDNRRAKVERVGAIISSILEYVNEFIPGEADEACREICDTNLVKLFDRKERGVLKGSGDNR